jgi:hypothetical protein
MDIFYWTRRCGLDIVGAMQKGKTMKVGPVTGEGRWETFGQERGARSGDRRTTRLCALIDIVGKRLAQKHAFLRNEPTVLEGEFLCITLIFKYLYRLQARFAGGFVLENEPTGEGF